MLSVLAVVATTAMAQPEFEASLSGYNLLWPSSRCCAFELKIYPDGKLSALVKVNGKKADTRSVERKLSVEELAHLRAAVEKAQVATLPAEIGDSPVDGDERKIKIRDGAGVHEISLGEAKGSKTSEEHWSKSRALWSALKHTFELPEANVE